MGLIILAIPLYFPSPVPYYNDRDEGDTMKTTAIEQTMKHNACCTMAFGRYSTPGACARCDELRAGAAPRKSWHGDYKARQARETAHIRNHDCKVSRCAIVCTFGDW